MQYPTLLFPFFDTAGIHSVNILPHFPKNILCQLTIKRFSLKSDTISKDRLKKVNVSYIIETQKQSQRERETVHLNLIESFTHILRCYKISMKLYLVCVKCIGISQTCHSICSSDSNLI